MSEMTITSDEIDIINARPVYTSLPDGVIDEAGFGTKFAIKKVLDLTPGRFWTASKLARLCGYNDKGSQVELRKDICELREIDHYPVVSCEKGFGKATNPEMILKYQEDLFKRMLGLRRNMDACSLIWKEMSGVK